MRNLYPTSTIPGPRDRMSNIPHSTGDLFRHVSAEKAQFYRLIMDTFASAKRQFRLQLRPDEVRLEAAWQGAPPPLEEIQLALAQLAEWGNLESQPDTARVSSIEDFYRARFLYRLSLGGEAVEAALSTFAQALARRSELQTVALEDILTQLNALRALAAAPDIDPAATSTFPHAPNSTASSMASVAGQPHLVLLIINPFVFNKTEWQSYEGPADLH